MSDLVRVHVLPGGVMPKRQTDGAVGYDVSLRIIASATEMDPKNPRLRKTLFDFRDWPTDPGLTPHIVQKNDKLCYRLGPHESVLGGIGFLTQMEFPMFYWVAPRSGLASRWGITVTNAPGTVDPDYRGEAGVLIYNRTDKPFLLEHNMRIAQIIFQRAIIPDLVEVSPENLDNSIRGAGGFGSTGI